MTQWSLTNNHKLAKKFDQTSFSFFSPPTPHTHTYVSHLDVHLRCCTGLIKHSLSDCLLRRRFGSIWPRPLWPGLILNILHREITSGRRDRDEERGEEKQGEEEEEEAEENGLRLQKQADRERERKRELQSIHLLFCFFLSSLRLSLSHTLPPLFFFFISPLPSVFLFISPSLSLMRAGGASL